MLAISKLDCLSIFLTTFTQVKQKRPECGKILNCDMDMEKVGHLLNTQCFVIKKCIHWGQFSYTQFRIDLQVIYIVRTQNLNLKVSFNNNSNTVYEFLPCIDHYN